jgi:hypothetical protein
MKITLRKADAIQKLINEKINESPLATKVTINRFDVPVEKFDQAVAKFKKVYDQKVVLLEVLYVIRKKVATAGAKAGIADLLAERALLDKSVLLLKPLADMEEFAPSVGTLALQHEDLLNDKGDASRFHGRRESFDVSIVDRNEVTTWVEMIAQSRKAKQTLSDKLLDLNVRTEIELGPDTEAVLHRYGLI